MREFFQNTTPIPSFSLLAGDWWFLTTEIVTQGESFDEILHELKLAMRVASPPIGTSSIAVTTATLGQLFVLYWSVQNKHGKEIGRPVRNRFKTALEALNLQTVTDFIAAIDSSDTGAEQSMRDQGRRILRGTRNP